jgi:lipopolysaccharide/colanic/teichoic acid biosynthesis glycosyltransferase
MSLRSTCCPSARPDAGLGSVAASLDGEEHCVLSRNQDYSLPSQRDVASVELLPGRQAGGPQPDAEAPLHGGGLYGRRVKPAVDRLLAALLLVLTLPLLLAAALAVLLTLGRPVILQQERVGLNGEVFVLRKFRTMRPCRRSSQQRRREAPAAPLPALPCQRSREDRRLTHKHPHDPRLVRVGRFLRTWSLDELPQLYNVVCGHMSLVGPRPEMPQIVARYEDWQHARHTVKPGVTGLWQVSDRGQDGVLMHHRTDVDLRYVRQLSFWLDLKLLLLTVPAALGFRRGM